MTETIEVRVKAKRPCVNRFMPPRDLEYWDYWRELKDEYAVEFLKATDDESNRPAFIHCASANRVGAFWMIRRVLRDGWTLEKAEEEARKIGLRNETLLAFAKDYIGRHQKN